MHKLIDLYCRGLTLLMVVALALMVLLVFGNVALRYGFNSGITISEEISRWLVVWLAFMGAVVALKNHNHLGTDVLVSRLPLAGKRVCLAVSLVAMLYVTWLLLSGAWTQMLINLEVRAPASGAPVAILYASGVLFGASGLVILLRDLLLLVMAVSVLTWHQKISVSQNIIVLLIAILKRMKIVLANQSG